MNDKADIGLIGLAVMGQNLILNMNDHGFTVVAYNRTTSKVDEFLANEAKGTQVLGAHSIEEMISKLKRPRRIMLMIKAGKAVDEQIEVPVAIDVEKGFFSAGWYAARNRAFTLPQIEELQRTQQAFDGLLAGMRFARMYNSRSEHSGAFGPGWSSWADARLHPRADGADRLHP